LSRPLFEVFRIRFLSPNFLTFRFLSVFPVSERSFLTGGVLVAVLPRNAPAKQSVREIRAVHSDNVGARANRFMLPDWR